MTDHDDAPDLRNLANASVPVKWVGAGLAALIAAAVTALIWTLAVGKYTAETDSNIAAVKLEVAELKRADRRQLATLTGINDTLTRMETITCATDDRIKIAACDRLARQRERAGRDD